MDWYIGNIWKNVNRGLKKEVLSLDFVTLAKPNQVAKVVIIIEDVQYLQINNINHNSKYLAPEQLNQRQELELGTAVTPIDCNIEILAQQMIVGERSLCSITTNSQENDITFTMTLVEILETKEIHKLTVPEMYALALRYKEMGVFMYKEYPRFAHYYFAQAAKCLISYKPFDTLTIENDGIDGNKMNALFIQLQTNLAACLLAEQRYDDVIYQTQFVETMQEPPEKCIYRRAKAYFYLKEFECAQWTIEKLPNYQEKKEFTKLHKSIVENKRTSNAGYKEIVQRMFK